MTKEDLDFKVVAGVTGSAAPYIRATTLAHSLGVSAEDVMASARRNPDKVRVSLLVDAESPGVLADKGRVTLLSDMWTTFRAISHDKLSA